jgi:tetratricopeptide (TPR) repeat protein
VGEHAAAARFWRELEALYRAAGRPTLKSLVHLGLAQQPPIPVSASTINGWLNHKAVPTGRKNTRFLIALIDFLQARVRPDARYDRLPPAEWGRLLRAAQTERAAGKKQGRPRGMGGPALVATQMRTARRPQRPAGAARQAEGWAEVPSTGSPLIGRDRELAVLVGLVQGVVAGRGAVVLVEGEPGIGKSTLLRAAVAKAGNLGCQVFWGTGSELDQALPLQPLLDGLRVREASGNPRREMIAGFLRGEIRLDGGMDGPSVLAEQLLALIADECLARPTILVVDDLQWADQASVRLLARLAGSARDLPLLLAAALRPVPQRGDMLGLRRPAGDSGRVTLAGLTETATAELVTVLAGGTPDGALLRLAGGAAGNPLYITELVAALTRDSVLAVDERGVATLRAEPVPRSLTGVIADRLDFISGQAREVLQSASLLGNEFTVGDLAIVSGLDVATLAGILREACAAGVLAESGDHLRFRHPLIQATLKQATPAPVRAALHREAGRALAAAGATPDQVARQLLSADSASVGTPEPMAEWMLSWLAEATEVLVSQAPPVAVALLRRALDSMPLGAERQAWLASRLASALYHVGEKAAAEDVATRTLQHAGDDPDVLVDLHSALALCRIASGQSAESIAELEHVLATPGLSARHRARLLVLTARAQTSCGELENGSQAAARALAAASEAGDRWVLGWALHTLARAAIGSDQYAEALSLHDRALAFTEGDPSLTDLHLVLQINKSVVLGNLDRYEEALIISRKALHLAGQVGTAIRLAQAHGILSQVFFGIGRWSEAMEQIAIMPESIKEPDAACDELGIAAVIAFHRGEVDAAREHLDAAARHASKIGHRLVTPFVLAQSLGHEQADAPREALSTLTDWLNGGTEEVDQVSDLIPDAARLARRIGDLDTARAIAAHAAESVGRTQTPSRRANALYCRGLLDRDGLLLLDAADQYQRASRPLQRAMALEAAGSEYVRTGDTEQAQAALATAAEVYAWLGATVDAARVGTLLDSVATGE